MDKDFKPTNYNSVSPYFIVTGAQKFIDLMNTIFDATELRRYNRTDGTIMHVEIKIDDSVIMLSDSSPKFPAVPMVMHIYVRNVDETFKKAINAGCEMFEAPVAKDGDDDKRGTFIDFAGNMWSVATQQKNKK